jgi:HSP20 family protein
LVKPQFHSKVKEMLGEDFSQLLNEIAPFVEPRMDVYKTKGDFIICMDIAGAQIENISIKMRNDILMISGTVSTPFEENQIIVITRERFYGAFKREIVIPQLCDLDQLKAEYSRGLLLITIPFHQHHVPTHYKEIDSIR